MADSTTGVLAAEALADALRAALADPSFAPVAERMVERYAGASVEVSVPLRAAAEELEVSLPTVRDWISRGLLVEVKQPTRRSRAVTIPSLAVVLAARSAGAADDPRPTAKIIDQLRDHRLLAKAQHVAATRSADDYVTYTDADLAELEGL